MLYFFGIIPFNVVIAKKVGAADTSASASHVWFDVLWMERYPSAP